ncbi:MAG TPA: response regulator [Nitrospirales bacterium]|nr:response regulator [Nitrospirales bacterium]
MAQEAGTGEKQKTTVLVVDDEQIICDLLQTVLSRAGYEVFTASTGRDGLAQFQRRRPQLTLLDLRMTEMNGIEVLKDIRKLDPQANVMILTAWGSDALERQARQLGVTDFLSKRMTLNAVMASLERMEQRQHKTTTAKAPGAAAAAAAAAAMPPTPPSASILIVDDEPQICTTLMQAITPLGYRVRSAASGAEALALVEQETPALIILDMHMPEMNGIGVLRGLQERKIRSGVILLTGSHDEKLMTEALDLGVVDIIGKPVSMERLTLAIQLGLMLKDR